MGTRIRALVARPRRKVHLATIGDGETAWLTTCDRDLPVEGTAAREHAWADTLDGIDPASVCAYCLGHLVVARVVLVEAYPEIVAEQIDLRRRLTAVLAEQERTRLDRLAVEADALADADAALARAVGR